MAVEYTGDYRYSTVIHEPYVQHLPNLCQIPRTSKKALFEWQTDVAYKHVFK